MRSSIIETRAEDYITTARAKGLSDNRILNSHAFPNALLPMVTLIAINLGYVVAGAITAEIVFNWPGLGTLTVQALDSRDYPLLQAIFLLIAISVVFANFARTSCTATSTRGSGNERHRARRHRAGRRPLDRHRPPHARLHRVACSAASDGLIGVTILAVFALLALAPSLFVARCRPSRARPASRSSRRAAVSGSAQTSWVATC